MGSCSTMRVSISRAASQRSAAERLIMGAVDHGRG
jgi:hypothetical protein